MTSLPDGFKDTLTHNDLSRLSREEYASILAPQDASLWVRHCVSVEGGNGNTGINIHRIVSLFVITCLPFVPVLLGIYYSIFFQ